MVINEVLISLLSLLFPPFCIHCGRTCGFRSYLCFQCESALIETDHFQLENNSVKQRLNVRAHFESGAALYIFKKHTPIQRLIHHLKYKSNFRIAELLGQRFGRAYLNSTYLISADIIIPIPIHAKRLKKRGYNQSLLFAKGISKITNIPVVADALKTYRQRVTQTQKSRMDRFENIKNSFKLVNESRLADKCVLLVDDVMTTGATLEAAIETLSKVSNIKIQIGLMALAEN